MSQTVLILAAHPDDEVLGCGGTIARFASSGANVHVSFLADGVFSRTDDQGIMNWNLQSRRDAAKKACDILGVTSLSFGDFPDNRMDSIAMLDITKAVETMIAKYKPETIFTHHAGDVNIDHRLLHQAVATACRPQNDNPVKTILCFEIPSSTEWQLSGSAPVFIPNWFVDISKMIDLKLSALEAYATELRNWPHPRSIKGVRSLAQWRGASVGVDAAEGFLLGRRLV